MNKGLPAAVFSEDRQYRYLLTRQWDATLPYVAFIGLNPSIADEKDDDNTIRKEMGFARRWGYGGIIKGNIFAYCATLPKDMKKSKDPIGPDNDKCLLEIPKYTNQVIACWGNDGAFMGRGTTVKKMLEEMQFKGYIFLNCLKITKSGHPHHPLYLPNNTIPFSY